MYFIFFFFNDTATTEIYTLSLHDALPISDHEQPWPDSGFRLARTYRPPETHTCHGSLPTDSRQHRDRRISYVPLDRKSTRLNSSHANISYAVFCLKKKKILYHIIYF